MPTVSGNKTPRGTRARSVARKLAMQALYQWQLTGHSAKEIISQFLESEETSGGDREYFDALLKGCIDQSEPLKEALAALIDRPLEQLDPVEAAILMIGVFELQHRIDVPYRVVINEGVDLCKRFGATDAHKYVNAVLDRAAKKIRPEDRQLPPGP